MGTMSLPIDFWNKVNQQEAAKNRQYKSLLQSLQAIHPGSVLLLRSPSDEPWLGQLLDRGQLFSKNQLKSFRGTRKRCDQNASCLWIMEQGSIATGLPITRLLLDPQVRGIDIYGAWIIPRKHHVSSRRRTNLKTITEWNSTTKSANVLSCRMYSPW